MCDTCPCTSTSSIPGPGEVGSDVLSAAVGAAISKPGRRVMFWTIAIPMLPFAVWGVFGWWTIALAAVLAVATAAGALLVRRLHQHHTLIVAPPSLQQRVALPAGRPVRKRARALPAPQQAIEPTRVIPARPAAVTPAPTPRVR